MTKRLTDEDFIEIRKRVYDASKLPFVTWGCSRLIEGDVPALLAEIELLKNDLSLLNVTTEESEKMEVVCIKSVYGKESGKLWCEEGTLYSAINREGNIYIKSEGEEISYSHCIFSDNTEMKEFYEKHFLGIEKYME